MVTNSSSGTPVQQPESLGRTGVGRRELHEWSLDNGGWAVDTVTVDQSLLVLVERVYETTRKLSCDSTQQTYWKIDNRRTGRGSNVGKDNHGKYYHYKAYCETVPTRIYGEHFAKEICSNICFGFARFFLVHCLDPSFEMTAIAIMDY